MPVNTLYHTREAKYRKMKKFANSTIVHMNRYAITSHRTTIAMNSIAAPHFGIGFLMLLCTNSNPSLKF